LGKLQQQAGEMMVRGGHGDERHTVAGFIGVTSGGRWEQCRW